MRILIILCLLLCAGCSQTTLLTRQDYQKSQREFVSGDDEDALLDFPRGKERGDFITTMEKGYLSLVQGRPQIRALRRQAMLQEKQVRYHVSREARTFFYVRTPEDYYPSEHEVIWLHLLLSWGYAQQGKYTDAEVEARYADELLTLPWSPNGHFDDPTLRLFLAGLWTMCGQWQEAQVDLRAASDLDGSLGWARELAAREKPPAQMFIVMGGPGPDVEWNPAFKANPLRGGRQLKFVLRGRKSALAMTDAKGMVIDNHLSPDAAAWYARHLERESELDELIQDSAYGGTATAASAKATLIVAGETGKGILRGAVTGALVGVGIIVYGLAQGGNAAGSMSGADMVSLLEGAAVVGGVIGAVVGGAEGAGEGFDSGSAAAKKMLDPTNTYRYVRYLPEYLWIGWTDKSVAYPVTLSTKRQTLEIAKPTVVNGTSVTLAHLSDSRQHFCIYKHYHGSTTMVTEPDVSGSCPEQPDI